MDRERKHVSKSPIKPPWVEKMSQSRGRVYYFNTSTGESTWTVPVVTASETPSNSIKDKFVHHRHTDATVHSIAGVNHKRRAEGRDSIIISKEAEKFKEMPNKIISKQEISHIARQTRKPDDNGEKVKIIAAKRVANEQHLVLSRASTTSSDPKNAPNVNLVQQNDTKCRHLLIPSRKQTSHERNKDISHVPSSKKKPRTIYDLVPDISKHSKRPVSERLTRHIAKNDNKNEELAALKKFMVNETSKNPSPKKKLVSTHDLLPKVSATPLSIRRKENVNEAFKFSRNGITDRSIASDVGRASASNASTANLILSNNNNIPNNDNKKPTTIHDLAVPIPVISLSDRLKNIVNEVNSNEIPYFGSASALTSATCIHSSEPAVPMEDVEMIDESQTCSNGSSETGDDDKMDWETTPESVITNIITKIRTIEDRAPQSVDIASNSNYIDTTAKWTNKTVLIVDTNIFLSKLSYIQQLIEKDSKVDVVILIPYMVIQELDKLKHQLEKSISVQAGRVIRFINNALQSKEKKILVQSAIQHKDHVIEIDNPDDKILNCCLQVKVNQPSVALVTNDMNLSIKAIATGINSLTAARLSELLLTS